MKFLSWMIRWLCRLFVAVLVVLVAILATVSWHLYQVWRHDPQVLPPSPVVGREDVSRFTQAAPAEVVAVKTTLAEAEAQLCALVGKVAGKGGHIAISGSRHSMGGHTTADGAVVIDMTPLKHVTVEPRRKTVTVGAGAIWKDVIEELQRHGLAVKVMQSNRDFTIGGSLSVNCHGWQQGLPPIAGTVHSLRVITADGQVRECTPDNENATLFRHVLGGYGLFGIITEATLDVVEDAYYNIERVSVTPGCYWEVFQQMTAGADVGMAYGRLNVAPWGFLENGTVNVLRMAESDAPKSEPAGRMETLKRLVFRGAVGSDFGKQLREWAESVGGETTGGWRSVLQYEPASRFGSHDASSSEILHEYFVPVERLAEFVEDIRLLMSDEKHPVDVDLLNITVRDVMPDTVTALPYAREHVFGLVMLFHLPLGAESDRNMRDFTQSMIDAALAVGGTYYLPYRLHATREQFQAAYPQSAKFFSEKQHFDPQGLFTNQFYQTYGPP